MGLNSTFASCNVKSIDPEKWLFARGGSRRAGTGAQQKHAFRTHPSSSINPHLFITPPSALAVEETGDALEHFLEPAQGAHVPVACSRFRQAENLGDFAVAQLLEMA